MTTQTPTAESGSEESHMDRAMLGPTPDNPSLSLKTRLKRAAFFDQRERQVAEGTAEPVDPEAAEELKVRVTAGEDERPPA